MIKKGQTTLEFAVLITVVIAGFLAMQIYLKRGVEGKLRASADSFGQQYSPGNTTGSLNITHNSLTRTTVEVDDTGDDDTITEINSEILAPGQIESSHGTTTVGSPDNETLY